jgi:hemoglobin/transferrin/lactoferrin receptor protein
LKKTVLNLILLLGFSGYAWSQVVTVLDAESGEVLELVTLTSESPKVFAITNTKGQADLSPFKNAEKIEFRAIGYKSSYLSYAELQDASFLMRLNPSLFNLDEVIISATRWKQRTSEIPSKLITITSKQLILQNPQTAADLLAISGKVFIQKSQLGGGSPMIRGFATNRLLYTIDGIRMNTAIFRSGNIQNVISLDPFAMEHTEVLFGPGSVIYGSDAIGGVMSFQTLTPQLSLSDKPFITGEAVTRYSSANNEKTGHLDLNVGWEKWAMLTSISSSDYGDLKMGSNGPDEYLRPFYVERHDSSDIVVTNDDPRIQRPSGYSQINMMQKVRFMPNDRWDLQYGFHYSETSEYSRYDRHIRYRHGLPRYGEWYYGPQVWMMNNLNITNTGDNIVYDQMTLRAAAQYFEESRIDRDLNARERHTRTEQVDAWSVNADFIRNIGLRHKLFYGGEAVRNNVASSGTDEDIFTGIISTGPSRYPQSSWSSYAIYVTDQFKLSEKFTVQSGLRYNIYLLDAEFDTTFYHFPFTTAHLNNAALTGSIGLVYRPGEKWVVSSNLSTAFRSPNVDDLGKVFDSEAGSVVVPNPDLKAEYAYNADLSLAKVFGDVVKVDLTGYYTLLKNAMVRRDYTLNGMDSIIYDGEMSRVQAVQNAAVAYVYGIQAGLEVKLPSGFGLSSDFNFQKGTEELDDGTTSPSRHAPPWYGITRLTYASGKLNLKFYAIYSGGKSYNEMPEEEKGKPEIYAVDDDGNPYSPGWYTLNFKAMYQLSDYLIVSAGLENITDQRYRPYSSGIVSPGRNFIISVRVSF